MAEEAPVAQKTESDRLDPWIKDGNIVLAVEGKYFRVHRSILSSYSEVFRDMFGCPEPTGSEGEKELIEQCPVIHLHDAATDVQIILKAMYDRSYPLPYYEKVPISIVAAFLHLGEKYAIRQLFNEAKARLCCAFESTLSVAAKMSSFRSKIPSSYLDGILHNDPFNFQVMNVLKETDLQAPSLSLFPGIIHHDPFNFQVMNLLQEMDLQAPLPLAMYQCVTACPLTAVLDGYKFNGSIHSLSRANRRSFFLIKDMLEKFRVGLTQSLRVSTSCVVQSSCGSNLPRLLSDEVSVGKPFGPWRHEWDKLFCDACRSDLNKWRTVAIQKAWNHIPTAFGFDSWAEVAKSGDFPDV